MPRYGLFGTLVAQPGKGTELGDILLQAAVMMENAPGCILYVVTRDMNNPDAISIMEVWETREDHDSSLGLPGVRELIMQAMPILAEKPVPGIALEVLGGKGLPREMTDEDE
jgi:quinol monooxygenase YgiN